jgi:DNA repair protein RecO (recombination protein O)
VDELRSLAFLLRSRAYGESDIIAVLLTAEHGKISGIARGARRSRRRFAGPALQPFHELEIRYKRRPHSELVFLQESRILADFEGVAADVGTFAWASYLTELTEVVLAAADPCRDVYDLYRETLGRLADKQPTTATSHHFALRLLEHAGWCPDFERCAVCATALTAEIRPIVDPRGGGVICARHDLHRNNGGNASEVDDPSRRPSRRIIDPELLEHVRASRMEPHPDCAPATLRAATALLDRLIELHVPRTLRARRVLAELTHEP